MDTIENLKKLLHFALLEVRGELSGVEIQAMREHYARIALEHLRPFMSICPAKILEVGGADGSLCKVFNEEFGADAVNLEPNDVNLSWRDTVRGVGHAIPFNNGAFDLVICRSVLEHIPSEISRAC